MHEAQAGGEGVDREEDEDCSAGTGRVRGASGAEGAGRGTRRMRTDGGGGAGTGLMELGTKPCLAPDRKREVGVSVQELDVVAVPSAVR